MTVANDDDPLAADAARRPTPRLGGVLASAGGATAINAEDHTRDPREFPRSDPLPDDVPSWTEAADSPAPSSRFAVRPASRIFCNRSST